MGLGDKAELVVETGQAGEACAVNCKLARFCPRETVAPLSEAPLTVKVLEIRQPVNSVTQNDVAGN